MSHEPLSVEQLAAARALLDTVEAAQRQVRAARASADQVLADMRTIRRNLLAADVCASCEPLLREALLNLGPLLEVAEETASGLTGMHAALSREDA